MIPPVVWTILYGSPQIAAVLVGIAVFTDGLDGFLAKNFDWRTRFGAVTDPIADKALFIAVFVTLAYMGLIPMWLLWVVVVRDLVIVCGGLAYHHLIGRFRMAPSMISKLNTLVQFLFVFSVLINLATGFPGAAVVNGMVFLVLATTLLSGLDYVLTWSKKAMSERSEDHVGGQ